MTTSILKPIFPQNDPNSIENLEKILNRQKGEIFRCNKGKLETVKGWKGRFFYWWRSEYIEAQKIVSKTLKALNDSLSMQRIDKQWRKRLRRSCSPSGNIGRLSKRIFDPASLTPESPLILQSLPKNTIRLKLGEGRYHDLRLVDKKIQTGDLLLYSLNVDENKELKDVQDNLWRIIHDKPKTRYNIKGGKLLPISGITCFWKKKENAVQKIVQRVVLALGSLTTQDPMIQSIVRGIFAGPLACLGNDKFDRSIIGKASALEKILMPDLNEKRVRYSNIRERVNAFLREVGSNFFDLDVSSRNTLLKNHPLDMSEFEKAKFDYNYHKLLFSKMLGIDLKKIKSGGSGGARLGVSHIGKPLFVIKPDDEGPHGPNNPRGLAFLKRFLIFPHCLRNNSEPLAEKKSYLLDRSFGIHVVPPTECDSIQSKNFNGKEKKECSLQMYVEDAVTLAEYLSIPSWMHLLPRFILSFYLSYFRKNELEALIPKRLMEKIGFLDFLGENTDTHFENILVKVWKVEPDSSKLNFLDICLDSERIPESSYRYLFPRLKQICKNRIPIDPKGHYRITLIKHDGGSSQPHTHPSSWFETRYKHFFEVLPFFGISPFTDDGRKCILNSENALFQFLYEKALLGLIEIISFQSFKEFIRNKDNLEVLKKWIFSIDKTAEDILLQELVKILMEQIPKQPEKTSKFYFTKNLNRLKGNMRTRVDCWRILHAHMLGPSHKNTPMRSFFRNIRSAGDFKKKLNEIGDDKIFFSSFHLAAQIVDEPKWLHES